MSRAKMPVDVAEFMGDVGHLSARQLGAYWALTMHYWQNDGLPTDERAIKRISRLSPDEWKEDRDVLYALFKLGNWKHKRIEFELTEAARTTASARKAGLASARKRAEKRQAKQEAATTVAFPLQRKANDPPTPKEVSKKERTLDPRGSNAADAAPKRPVYTDSKHELWGEGVPILTQLGLSDNSARANIGRWLRDTKDDAQAVLGAIQRAREHRVIDPVPWITRALKPGSKADVAESRSLVAAARRAAERFSGAPDLGDVPSEPLFRLLPQS